VADFGPWLWHKKFPVHPRSQLSGSPDSLMGQSVKMQILNGNRNENVNTLDVKPALITPTYYISSVKFHSFRNHDYEEMKTVYVLQGCRLHRCICENW
jgi:hypothetical protein